MQRRNRVRSRRVCHSVKMSRVLAAAVPLALACIALGGCGESESLARPPATDLATEAPVDAVAERTPSLRTATLICRNGMAAGQGGDVDYAIDAPGRTRAEIAEATETATGSPVAVVGRRAVMVLRDDGTAKALLRLRPATGTGYLVSGYEACAGVNLYQPR